MGLHQRHMGLWRMGGRWGAVYLNDCAYPVERHIPGILKNIMVWMSHDPDVSCSFGALRTQRLQGVFGVGRVAAYRRLDLFVDHYVDLDPSLCPSLQHLIQPPFLVEVRRPPQEQLGTYPPILKIYRLFGALQRDADGPKVISRIDVPLDHVSIVFRGKAFKSVALGDLGPLLIGDLFMLLIVTVVGIKNVFELAELVLDVRSFDLCVVDVGVLELFAKPAKKFVVFGSMIVGGGGLAGNQARGTRHVAGERVRRVGELLKGREEERSEQRIEKTALRQHCLGPHAKLGLYPTSCFEDCPATAVYLPWHCLLRYSWPSHPTHL